MQNIHLLKCFLWPLLNELQLPVYPIQVLCDLFAVQFCNFQQVYVTLWITFQIYTI